MKAFSIFLIKRPLLSKMILAFIIAIAAFSLNKINLQQFPRVDLQELTIITEYPSASPQEVELNVTVKLEDALKEIVGIKTYTSRSIENVSIIKIVLEDEIDDPQSVKNDIRRAIDSVNDLPDEVEKRPTINEIKVDLMPVFEVVLTSKNNDEAAINSHIKDLKRKITRLPEVATVKESSVRDQEIAIKVDKDKLNRAHVSFPEIINKIRSNKVRLSGGAIESVLTQTNIITLSEFDKIEDLGNLPIRTTAQGHAIKLKDLAEIKPQYTKLNQLIRFNGKKGSALIVSKKAHADIVKTSQEINKVISDFKTKAPDHINISTAFDGSMETKSRLSIVTSNALLGFFLVLLVLFIFLGRKTAFWTAFGIPISLAMTCIGMAIFGISINSVSLCGLIIVLGMVVDDAIIISESISRRQEEGDEPEKAALDGLSLVLIPVVCTIITTMIAFLPVFFIPGIIGKFAGDVPSVVILMLAASFIEAAILLPVHLAHAGSSNGSNKPGSLGRWILKQMESTYDSLLKTALKQRYLTIFLCIFFLFGGFYLSIHLTKFKLFPSDQASSLFIYGETKNNSNLTNVELQAKKIEQIIEKVIPKKDIISYKTQIGKTFQDPHFFPNCSTCFVIGITATPFSERSNSILQYESQIKENAESIVADGSLISLHSFVDGGGPPVGKPLEIRILGNDNVKRTNLIAQLKADLSNFDISEIESDYTPGKQEIKITPDYEVIDKFGIDMVTIAQTIRTAFDGIIVTHQQTADEKIPFRLSMADSSVDLANPLNELYVPNKFGHLIPINKVITTKTSSTNETIYRHNGRRVNTISANIDTKKTSVSDVYTALRQKHKDFESINPGFSIELGGEIEESNKVIKDIGISLILALLAIYSILVVQFNSLIKPVVIISCIPFGLLGIVIAFGLQGINLSMLALIGILGFTGVIVNASLLMVEFISRECENIAQSDEGTSISSSEKLQQAIIIGARQRLRPIVLTTISTMAGLIPTAYGWIGGTDSFVSPMVMAMAWGLFVGTIFALLIIPTMYLIFEDFKNIGRKNKKN